jgi:ATP-binding cassette subfamily F protein 3
MIVLHVENIRKHFGPEPVLDGVSFDVHPGQKIGLVGPNGSGKTTLMRILAGFEEADAGDSQLHPTVRLGYLQQQPLFDEERTVWDEARDALGHWVELQDEAVRAAEALAAAGDEAERQRLTDRYDRLQLELQRHDAYNLDHRVERVLGGLGFAEAQYRLSVSSLSGGEQNRLMLARLLLAEPELMLLDEPSNHLDIEATEWLEQFLAASSAAMIVVSHDRYFLDKVTNRTLELFRGTVDGYTGNFSAYWQQKAERLLVQQRTYEKQQTEIAKTEDFIRRNAYGQKHAQAEDRRKKLARIEEVQPPRNIEAPPMTFAEAQRSGDIVLRASNLAKGYERPLFSGVDLEITRGQRWALLGPNGSGKTTLLRCLLGQEEPDDGKIALGHGVQVGYFDQQLAALDDSQAVVDAIRPEKKQFELQQRRDMLARFGLTGDTALQPVSSLSGGERCRAALARLAASDANFLVLDEPTNHLDLWARDALEKALSRFEGSVLFVSHDRYFVNRVADHLLVVQPGRFRVIEGNYDTYLHLVERGLAEEPADARSKPTPKAPRSGPEPKRTREAPGRSAPAAKNNRKRRFPFRKVEDIEDDIVDAEMAIERIHADLAKPQAHRDGQRAKELKDRLAEAEQHLKSLYEHWEEAMELNW